MEARAKERSRKEEAFWMLHFAIFVYLISSLVISSYFILSHLLLSCSDVSYLYLSSSSLILSCLFLFFPYLILSRLISSHLTLPSRISPYFT